jgi:hypothetical protein
MSEPTPAEGTTDINKGPAGGAREAGETSREIEVHLPGRLDAGALVDEGAATGPDVPPKTSEV